MIVEGQRQNRQHEAEDYIGQQVEADFAFGLNLILDGLQRVLDSTRS